MIDITHRSSSDLLDLYDQTGEQQGSFEFSFPVNYQYSKVIRDFVALIFDRYGLMPPWKSRFILIIDELINNSIAYGSIEWEMNIFRLFIKEEKQNENQSLNEHSYTIRVEVQDTGTGEGTKTANEMRWIRDQSHETFNSAWHYMGKRGRWLFMLTENLVDILDFQDNPKWGLTVIVQKSISVSGETQACQY